MEASTFSKPIRIMFNDINTIIVWILIFILVIKIEIRIDIRNSIVEIGLGILSILSILNVVVRPILMIAFIPLIAASFGVFMLIINALMLWLMMGIVPGIHVTSFWMLIVVSVLLNIFM